MEMSRAEKLQQAGIKKYGSLEAYKKALAERGRIGGRASFEGKGFAGMTPEQRREAGRKGGLNRGKSKE